MKAKNINPRNLMQALLICLLTLFLVLVSVPYSMGAVPDSYEPDNTMETAKVLSLNTQNAIHVELSGYEWHQFRNFYETDDEDWVKFYAIAGETYKIIAKPLGKNCDTMIEIYDAGGNRIKGPVDDYFGPDDTAEYAEWNAPSDGVYYAKITLYGEYGEGTEYELQLCIPAPTDLGLIYVKVAPNTETILTSPGTYGGITNAWGACFMPYTVSESVTLTANAEGYEPYLITVDIEDTSEVPEVDIFLTRSKAIILAGGGPFTGNDLWDAVKMLTDYAYQTLIQKGYTDDNIYFMSPETLSTEVDADATVANLEYAIKTWAQNAHNLFIYMVGHGDDGKFQINEAEWLNASDLGEWLDTLPGDVTLVYDASKSGSFLVPLASGSKKKKDSSDVSQAGPSHAPRSEKKRISATSCAQDKPAAFDAHGTISFSYFFWERMSNGDSFNDAFDSAKNNMTEAYSQTPQLDGDGDSIGNEAEDVEMAGTVLIGKEMEDTLFIGSVSPPQVLENKTLALIYASDVICRTGVGRVWAVIIPPLGDSSDFVTIEMAKVGNDRYKATYDGFTSPGTYGIMIYATDSRGASSLPKSTHVTVIASGANRTSKAIIVAGDGEPYIGNDLRDGIRMLGDYSYKALLFQGYAKDAIYYLASDTTRDPDGNGLPDDVDNEVTLSNLQDAITSWAQDADDLLIYMVGHGGDKKFRMNETDESLEPEELDTWLDTIQETIPGTVTIIYEGCQSEGFLNLLPPQLHKQRILVSTAPGSILFASQGKISFSYNFWTRMFNGESFYKAFVSAHKEMASSFDQIASLDANANGVGNGNADLQAARDIQIGNGNKPSDETPAVGSVSVNRTLKGQTTAQFYAANVTDADGISRVWAVVLPPDIWENIQGDGPDVPPLTDLTAIELTQAGNYRYEATYDGFTSDGVYKIIIYAQDSTGRISFPKRTALIKIKDADKVSKAVIVTGSGPNDREWEAIRELAKLANRALSDPDGGRGYDKDTIYYLSSGSDIDLNGDGVSDGIVDAVAGSKNFEDAIKWAQDAKELFVYMVGHGIDGKFDISESEILEASKLDEWLDAIQQNNADLERVILFYEGCYSGSFLPLLSPPEGKERILMTSSDSKKKALVGGKGSVSFSSYFWTRMILGKDFYDSFTNAKQSIILNHTQNPQIDANGNGIGNEGSDKSISRNIRIGRTDNNFNEIPYVTSVPQPVILEEGMTSALIYADDIISEDGVAQVQAVITPPDYSGDAEGNDFVSLPVIDLYHAGNGRFERSYHEFATKGTYKIAIFASDEDGDLSPTEQFTVTQLAKDIVLKGDINGDQRVDLSDAVIALKAAAGKDPGTIRSDYASSDADVSGDGKVGLEEIIYILAKIAD